MVCRLSKYAYFLLYKKANIVTDLAYTFIKNIIENYGTPREIISNKDKLFISNFWQLFIKNFGTKQKMLIIFYLQINSQTKKINQIVEQYLRHYINYQQNN